MAQFRNVMFLAPAPVLLGSIALAVLGGLSTSGCKAYHNEAERLEYKKMLDAEEQRLFPDAGTGVQGVAGAPNGPVYTYVEPGYAPPDPTQCPNNNTCLPDQGPQPVTLEMCKSAMEGLEFYPIPVWNSADTRANYWDDKNRNRLWEQDGPDKEDKRPDTDLENFVTYGYTYKDDTTMNFYPRGWEPTSIKEPWGLCDFKDNHVFHISGGPFLEWGGGLGRSLRCMNTTNRGSKDQPQTITNPTQIAINKYRDTPAFHAQTDRSNGTETDVIYCHTDSDQGACDVETDKARYGLCPQRDRDFKAKSNDLTSVPAEDLALLGMAVDLSQWDGISFWARRGPNSQPGIRILIGDKYTDDDVSFGQYIVDNTVPRHCERAVECTCKSASRPCTQVTPDEARGINKLLCNTHTDEQGNGCGDLTANNHIDGYPYDLNPIQPNDTICWNRADGIEAAAQNLIFCGDSTCRHQFDSAKSLNVGMDPLIADTTCQEYSFRGSITAGFCYNPNSSIPAQQHPAETSQQCGDHWMKSVTLSENWEFYTIPFTDLWQQGWAKRQYLLDLTAVTLLRFTWDRGYIDYYIDGVRFYRKCKDQACTADAKGQPLEKGKTEL